MTDLPSVPIFRKDHLHFTPAFGTTRKLVQSYIQYRIILPLNVTKINMKEKHLKKNNK